MRDATPRHDDATLEVVLFRVGEHLFGVEASQVRGSCLLAEPMPVTIEFLLGFPDIIPACGRQGLTIKGDEQDTNISVEAPLELRSLPVEAIYPLPLLLAVRSDLPGLRALATTTTGVIPLIDLHTVLLEKKTNDTTDR